MLFLMLLISLSKMIFVLCSARSYSLMASCNLILFVFFDYFNKTIWEKGWTNPESCIVERFEYFTDRSAHRSISGDF